MQFGLIIAFWYNKLKNALPGQGGQVHDYYDDIIHQWGDHCYQTYCYHISKCAFLLPSHIRAVSSTHPDDNPYLKNKGMHVGNQELLPPVNLMSKELDQDTIDQYLLTWCVGDQVAKIENGKLQLIIHGRPPDP